MEGPVKQLLHPSWICKIRPENLHLVLLLGPQDLWYAEMCMWEPEISLHLILLEPEQRILSFFIESTFTAHRSAQPSVTHCFSAVYPSEMKKGGKYEPQHYTYYNINWIKGGNTTKKNLKGKNSRFSSHWKRKSIGRDKPLI